MDIDGMIDLTTELNDLTIDNEDNPFDNGAAPWPFEFYTNNYWAGIRINRHELTYDFDEEGQKATKVEVLESALDELESWLPALQSAIWALGKALEKEKAKAVQIEGNA